MFTVIIAFILFIVGLTAGYALRPKLDRKISYKKRGRATKQRAAAKRASKTKTVQVQGGDTYLQSSTTHLN